MKKLKVILLVHKDLVPPKNFASKKDWLESECKTEFDVYKGLSELGHDILTVPVFDDLSVIRNAIDKFRPHIAFNLLEEFNGEVLYEQNVVSYLELMGLKYTGSNPRGLMLSRDKGIAKKLLAYHGVKTPEFRIFQIGKKNDFSNLKYPLFVKSLNHEASLGISQNSVVKNETSLRERIEFLHENYQVDVLVEQYIEGREFYVAVMGNRNLKTFPIWELFFDNPNFNGEKIFSYKAKWDHSYRHRHKIKTGKAKPLSETVEEQLIDMSKRAYEALSITGYARMDLRLSNDNEVYFIEANPNPDIGFQEDFADAVKDSGVDYNSLLNKILKMGLD